MAKQQKLPPSAAALSESMRDLGYALETAVADILDNSISADATAVEIVCDLSPDEPVLAVVDDGCGMSEKELIAAMRHGARNPKEERKEGDLGRFGLGLKTASFSQCRCLTVISRKTGKEFGMQWDLDLVDKKDDWIVNLLDAKEVSRLPYFELLGTNGTLVLWTNLDRLFEDQDGPRRDEIVNEKLDIVERHLSLVFHKFLSGEVRGRKKLSIKLNGHKLEPFDPFCRKNSATQMLPEEKLKIAGRDIFIQPYILPHHSKLSKQEFHFYQDRNDFLSNQGCYIYRNHRLMAWGDWFRLIPKGESTKLARVEIDFPSALDERWDIDIKKSRARPPHAVRERLRQVIARIAGRSTTVHRGRGKKLFEEIKAPVWERYADQGMIRYAINRDHPLLANFMARVDPDIHSDLNAILEWIASSLPIEMLYSDYSTSPQTVNQSDLGDLGDADILEKLAGLKAFLCNGGDIGEEAYRDVLKSTRMFDAHNTLVEKFIRENFNGAK